MKPVRRKIRKHYGSTAKKLAVRSQRPWYYRWVLGSIILIAGYSTAYWQYAAGGEGVADKLKHAIVENQQLQTRVIQVERQIQIEQAAQANLNKALNTAQDENIKIKEDLLFYKNMVSKNK